MVVGDIDATEDVPESESLDSSESTVPSSPPSSSESSKQWFMTMSSAVTKICVVESAYLISQQLYRGLLESVNSD